jgi:peptide deformylase
MDKSLILRLGNPVLRQPCVDVTFPNPQLKSIVASTFLVMYKSQGVGLAANQLGLKERIAVIDVLGDQKGQITLINPTIVESTGSDEMTEGCLSLPGFDAKVTRAMTIKVKNHDLDGNESITEYSDFIARAIQHEIDHLDGKLFVDRLSSIDRIMNETKLKRLVRSYKKEAKGMEF